MVERGRIVVAFLTAMGIGGFAAAQLGPRGYLSPGAFDILAVLPPAPATGDARDAADRAIFRATRTLVGTPRYDLAINDVKLTQRDMFGDFGCALGVALTPELAPKTAALLSKVTFDTARSSSIAKDFYKRKRPYLVDKGEFCQPADELKTSYDYPSGHTTLGWAWATILAELAPDRATPIMARGRAYGESRIVCGVHNASAVEAGRVTAAATLAAIDGDPAFLGDRAAARAEIERLRHDPAAPRPSASVCAREAGLVAQRVF